MPLDDGYYGTNSDGKENFLYCKFCYRHGQFTEPNLTLDQMIQKSVTHMMDELQMEEPRARELVTTLIPTLKRWGRWRDAE